MKWQADSKVLIQGVHHPQGSVYVQQMRQCGTQLVAGVSAGHGGETLVDIPIFDLVEEALKTVGPVDLSLILNPPYRVLDAALEAIAAGIRQLVIVSAGIPPLDMVQLLRQAQATQTFILGSGSQGIMVPGEFAVGTFDPHCYTPGPVGIISRCDRLTDDIAGQLTQVGLGQSLVVSLGTDGLTGSDFEQWLQVLEEDEKTQAIILLGQPNSHGESEAADYIASAIEKPVVAYLTGRYAKLDKHFGNSLTIITNQLSHHLPAVPNVAQAIAAFEQAAILVAQHPWDIAPHLETLLTQPDAA